MRLEQSPDKKFWWVEEAWISFRKPTTIEQARKIIDLLESIGEPDLVINALNLAYGRKIWQKTNGPRGRRSFVNYYLDIYQKNPEGAKRVLDDWEAEIRLLPQYYKKSLSRTTLWRIKKGLKKIIAP